MSSVCIVTDSTAQFPQIGFAGRDDIRVLPFSVEVSGQLYLEGQDLRPADLPTSASDTLRPRLVVPSPLAFEELFVNLSQRYREIIAILSSSHLTQAFESAQAAAAAVRGSVSLSVIDSQTTSIGLGLLVQSAAEAAAAGRSAADIERSIRSMIHRVYMMVCAPGMTYLAHAGFIDPAQAFVGEMLSLMPIFTLEEGQLSAVEKVRNSRGLIDFMQEFVMEFEDLLHIAFIQSSNPQAHEAKAMREHADNCFPDTPFSEHNLNLPLSILFGPRAVALIVVEKE